VFLEPRPQLSARPQHVLEGDRPISRDGVHTEWRAPVGSLQVDECLVAVISKCDDVEPETILSDHSCRHSIHVAAPQLE